ncbi:MAG: carboxypeptidase regulatory-like domain-containing protein [Anaerolineales bacterium]
MQKSLVKRARADSNIHAQSDPDHLLSPQFPARRPLRRSTFTPLPSLTPFPTLTGLPSATPTLPSNGSLAGQVIASKPVTVSLFDGSNALVASVTANPDGTFSLSAPAGTYTVQAAASGFISAQGSAVITSGNTTTKPTINLLAGDIDGNNVIDQFDALTIGINYNSAAPAAADLNNDGVINVLDLETLAKSYRKTGPILWE